MYGPAHLLRKAWLSGARDYLKEPWHPDELFLRVRGPMPSSIKWDWGNGTLHLQGTRLRSKADSPMVRLTRAEADLLRVLVQRAGSSRVASGAFVGGPMFRGKGRRYACWLGFARRSRLSQASRTTRYLPSGGWATGFLERSVGPWYPATVKDSLLNLLVFLLVFLVVAGLFLAFYGISLTLVPGGKGLVFANPFAGALIPAVLGGLAAAQFRSVRKPGNFAMTWILQAVTFFLLLSLAIPVIKKMPPVRASDESPLVPGRFLPLDDNSLILSAPHPGANRSASPTVLIPADGSPMFVSADTQYDPLNQRFVFSRATPRVSVVRDLSDAITNIRPPSCGLKPISGRLSGTLRQRFPRPDPLLV